MSKAELQSFPAKGWKDMPPPGTYAKAENYFQQALWYNPAQRTANHRLGLIAMQVRDFEAAARFLVAAHQSDPDHRGIRKALGYTYVWLGQIPKASQLLSILPETEREMSAYIDWWREQGRPDLAEHAQRMVEHLKIP
jgi:thioredoxin-like negative regulator of GroEL